MSCWSAGPWPARQQPRSQLRVGDTERNHTAEELSRHFAAGRLDQQEFDERMDAAMHAKTQSELDRLLHDLPAEDRPVARRHRGRGWLPVAFAMVLLAVVASATLHAAVVHGALTWWPFAVVAIVVLLRRDHRHSWRR
jgi:Flp pilus assembly protein TadB